MGLRINTNMASVSAQRSFEKNSKELSKTLTHLSSGSRITSASDDAAGLAISENLRGQIVGLQQANRNSNDAVSFVQVAEGGLNEVSNILIRLRELSIQAASDTIGDKERKFVDQEFQALKSEVDRIANSTNFNRISLLNGESDKSTLEFQVGGTNQESSRINFQVGDINARISNIGIDDSGTSDIDEARDSINDVDKALDTINGYRASLGALQNRLNSASNSLGSSIEGLSGANSRIRDADMALETADYAKRSILQQAEVAVLAQTNQSSALALRLL